MAKTAAICRLFRTTHRLERFFDLRFGAAFLRRAATRARPDAADGPGRLQDDAFFFAVVFRLVTVFFLAVVLRLAVALRLGAVLVFDLVAVLRRATCDFDVVLRRAVLRFAVLAGLRRLPDVIPGSGFEKWLFSAIYRAR